jgi:hypothetical protein
MRSALIAAVLFAAIAGLVLLQSARDPSPYAPVLGLAEGPDVPRPVAFDLEPLPIPSSEFEAAAKRAAASPVDVPQAEPPFVVRVLNQAGQPIPKATVYVEKMSRESVRELGRTGPDGEATLAQRYFPVKGQSLFAVVPNGRSTQHGHAGSVATWPGPVELRVPSAPSEPGAFGVVTAAGDDTPIQGASLTLHPTPKIRADGARGGALGAALAPIRSDADGRFKLPFIASHSSVEALLVSMPGYAPVQLRWSEVDAAQKSEEPLVVAMEKPRLHRGVVRFEDGALARGVTVGVRPIYAPFGWLVSTRTDQDGRFELEAPPGEIEVTAILHAYASDSATFDPDDDSSTSAMLELELPYDSTTRVLLKAPSGVDREGLSLFVEDDFGLTEYSLIEKDIAVYVLGETAARLMLAKRGSQYYESFAPIAMAEGVLLKGGVTQTVELHRPRAGSIEIAVSSQLLERLGDIKEVHLGGVEPGHSPYTRKVAMIGSKMRIDDVPAGQPISVYLQFHGSLEMPLRIVDVTAGESVQVSFDE